MNRRKTIERKSLLWKRLSRSGNRRVRHVPSGSVLLEKFGDLQDSSSKVRVVFGAVIKGFVLVALLVGLSFGGYFGYRHVMTSPYFSVKNIEVSGVSRVPTKEIHELLDRAKGRSILRIDLAAIERNLVIHPWIKSAAVFRNLPGTLNIEIEEQKAEALVSMGQRYLVNSMGEPFKRAEADEEKELPLITGIVRLDYLNDPLSAAKRIRKALDALKQYEGHRREDIAQVQLGLEDDITFILETGGVALHFGHQLTKERLRKLDAVWAALGPEFRRAQDIYLDNEISGDRVVVRMNNYQ
ncbi:MAG: FtsQ-type POTRA domain-containing protein [Pseudomonadota bacterium]